MVLGMAGRDHTLEDSELADRGVFTRLLGVAMLDPPSADARLMATCLGFARMWPLLIGARLVGIVLTVLFAPALHYANATVIGSAIGLMLCDAGVVAIGVAGRKRLLWSGYLLLAQIVLLFGGEVLCRVLMLTLTGVQDVDILALAVVIQYGGAFVSFAIISSNRLAMLAYVLAVATATILLAPWQSVLLGFFVLLPFGVIALAMGHYQESRNVKRLNDRKHNAERAADLVIDFERSGYGWFWETDRSGRISYISSSVADRLKCSAGELLGQSLSSLMMTDRDEGTAENRTLGFHLSARSAFRDLAVQAKFEGEEELSWSVSGTPIINELGHFQGFRGIGTDLTAMKRSQQENNQLARYDTLTGLANRFYIKQLLEKALVSVSGHPQPCGLFMLDLDKFKQVNDTLGHPVGDLLLQQVGKRLHKAIGDKGQVGRLGGDEFQVVLPHLTNADQLTTLAKSVILSLSKPYSLNGNQVVIGASIGISIFEHGPIDTAALIRNADLALYAAKAAGRGVCRFYESDMHAIAAERQKIEDELRVALASGQFELEYQPVVDVSTEKISGFEALLRWNHPRLGRYSPANFIPVAEEAGMIVQIGEWVLRTACEQAARWPVKTRVAVNVSPAQFTDPSFITTLIYALSSSGLEAKRLELEITEGIFLIESEETSKIFQKVKDLGVRLALDDFGTGYSALGYLKKAPFDKIKIDQSFVRGASQPGSINGAIITSIVSLAESLNMETTAEGAETHDELGLVRSLGCSHIQGYIYGKPMPNAEASELLTKHDGFAVAIGFARSREKRQRMIRKAALHFDDYCYEGRVRNLSSQGAMIEGLWDVPVGTIFNVQLAPDIFVDAAVRWSTENTMGVLFNDPVDVVKLAKAPRLEVREGPVQLDRPRKAG